jgi:hypothetical protein
MTKSQALFIHFLRNRLEFSYGRITQAFEQRYIYKLRFDIDTLGLFNGGSHFERQLCHDASSVLGYNIDEQTLEDLL